MERFDIDESFEDGFLTAECGVPVTTHAQGHITVRTFEGGGTGVAELTRRSSNHSTASKGTSRRPVRP
jgi:hypothetical protein